MATTEETFIELTAGLDYPMVVVTVAPQGGGGGDADPGQRPAGCLVGFSTQCSIEPPRYLVCLSNKNRTEHVAATADRLAVHFLDGDQVALARLFGEHTTDADDSFARCRWHPGPGGAPVLADCERWFVGAILERRVLGDHVGYLLEPVAARSVAQPRSGLFFQQVKQLEPGHAP